MANLYRSRWRGVPLGGALQRGCQFCFAANEGDSGWDDLVARLPTAAALAVYVRLCQARAGEF